MPLRLDDGWNTVHFNLADFTRRAYGTNYVETLRVQVLARNEYAVLARTHYSHMTGPGTALVALHALLLLHSSLVEQDLYKSYSEHHRTLRHAGQHSSTCDDAPMVAVLYEIDSAEHTVMGPNVSSWADLRSLQVHANCRLRRIYFSDKLYTEDELPPEFKIFLPIQVCRLHSSPAHVLYVRACVLGASH